MSEYDLSEVDGEAFEWLEYAEEFFKHDGSFDYGVTRTIPVRNNTLYESVGSEFRQLEAMYEACPGKVVEPLMAIEKQGEVVGFYMERFDGEHLSRYLEAGKGDSEKRSHLVDQVDEFLREIGDEGLVHGDLSGNVLCQGDEIKVIDPVGVPQDAESHRKLRKMDEEALNRLNKRAEIS